MAAESRLGPRDPNITDPSSWWEILPSTPPGETTRGVLAGLSALSVIALCVCWAALLRGALAGRVSIRGGLAAAVAWSAPFAVGPPLYSRDAYAYAAQGELARLGLDPATHGVSALRAAGAADGSGLGFVRAVDPRWADTHSPYGSAAVAIEKATAALGGGPGGTVVALRVVAVLATVALVVLTLRLAGRGHRAVAAVAVAANPVIIMHLVGGSHFDALAAALVAAALARPGATEPENQLCPRPGRHGVGRRVNDLLDAYHEHLRDAGVLAETGFGTTATRRADLAQRVWRTVPIPAESAAVPLFSTGRQSGQPDTRPETARSIVFAPHAARTPTTGARSTPGDASGAAAGDPSAVPPRTTPVWTGSTLVAGVLRLVPPRDAACLDVLFPAART
ncbi:polyprenol phosphomannose-dependent alpha 1,6 mannosyltransferase MptB [Frankia sp. AgKG'84/4]|uniref:polyprenol phosphomannose-dependent alpha 1,6 mannosyltransferase MptB n=1 Tax=Frankia sp. AgKG'84/4 TaxID=573490 RepID=UPI0027E52A65|nr:polyprenol phosphomannose-dependent alpha 1,6 mannosyltransferase MptB [Frankia sp. AgKG'84/4]